MFAAFEPILRNLMDRLRKAREDGWYRTNPDHYRAIVASLDTLLRQYRDHRASQGRTIPGTAIAEHRPVATPMPFVSRRSWRPLLSPIPISGGRH
jgi:hypothetical protein